MHMTNKQFQEILNVLDENKPLSEQQYYLLTKQMLAVQQRYFKTKDRTVMQESIRIEQLVKKANDLYWRTHQ